MSEGGVSRQLEGFGSYGFPQSHEFRARQARRAKITRATDLANGRNVQKIKVADLVLVRQRPGTAGGVCFMTIEDETGGANLRLCRRWR